MNFVCVLKSGGIYTPAHVERLRAMVWQPVTCLTDCPDVPGPTLPLRHGWPGWWSKLELFEHDLGHVCYFDLDVTVQSLDWLKDLDSAAFYAMADAYQPGGCPVNSSVMVWQGPMPAIVAGFGPEAMAGCPGGDQEWIWRKLGSAIRLIQPPAVVSYKKHGKKAEYGVVVYHGRPKPWDVAEFEYELLALFPNSTLPRKEQYDVAWGALHTDVQRYSAGERAHAKCWLTYRAFDGEVTWNDWLKNVDVVKLPPTGQAKMDARWSTSQSAAEVYLKIKNEAPWIEEAKRYLKISQTTTVLADNPGACANLVRVGSLLAYKQYLDGDEEECAVTVSEVYRLWGETWSKINPMENPYRYVEMRKDSTPLYLMMRLMHAMGRVSVYFYKPEWAENLFKTEEKSPWWSCVLSLARHPRCLW